MRCLSARTLSLPSAVLALCVSYALGQTQSLLEPRSGNSTSIPAPIFISPDENWDGIDGSWSTFTLRLGTPPQYVRTCLSFASYQTLAILPQGCQAATDQEACANARGWLFNESASSTFDRLGIYDLHIGKNLGLESNAIYGYDTVGLGGQGEQGPTLKNTTVGGMAAEDFYLGVFGVNPKPTNFTSFHDPSPSYMTLLKQQGFIPSLSFGYTAGALYRFTGVLASLVLGGYDTSKFVQNNITFNFAADNDRDIVVAIQSISTPSSIESNPTPTELLPNAVYAYIDSTVAQIWLPIEACRVFEQEFSLVYDSATGLYLVNDTMHDILLQRNPNVTFSLGQTLTGGSTVQISLPYAAFDLRAQPPYRGLSNTTRYFPLRRAQNDTQYTLGRTFLQEAYISVDWQSGLFNVSQVDWVAAPEQHLVPIIPGEDNGNTGDGPGGATSSGGPSSGLSTGAKAGVAVGAVAGVAILVILGVFIVRRRRQSVAVIDREKSNSTGENVGGIARHRSTRVYPKAELEGSYAPVTDHKRLLSAQGSSAPGTPGTPSSGGYFPAGATTPMSTREGTQSSAQSGQRFSPSGATASEADSRELQVHEMPGDMPAIREKDGRALSEKEAMARRERVYNGVEPSSGSASVVNGGSREPRRVDPDAIVDAGRAIEPRDRTLHRQFSFEADGERHV
ncbi:hypothetical protein DOTSEDRAFT_70614 [Dothistroma septosporum NZE10]|uniref:Peptidase A1 domain-containing protein n=1 Tax=Dothistroma septosporum (strain NZE10 / CBS 128990) TaxID=675120 RepID=N1PTF8_DOTSN|nr:hypothetical protein DOTSEDRAFT_70614 [Dothistroma septosporum NZE10]